MVIPLMSLGRGEQIPDAHPSFLKPSGNPALVRIVFLSSSGLILLGTVPSQ